MSQNLKKGERERLIKTNKLKFKRGERKRENEEGEEKNANLNTSSDENMVHCKHDKICAKRNLINIYVMSTVYSCGEK